MSGQNPGNLFLIGSPKFLTNGPKLDLAPQASMEVGISTSIKMSLLQFRGRRKSEDQSKIENRAI